MNIDDTTHLFCYSTGETGVRTYYHGPALFRTNWNAAGKHTKNIFKEACTSEADERRRVGGGLVQPKRTMNAKPASQTKLGDAPLKTLRKAAV